MLKCKTCGGTYEPVTGDGVRYYHACPPETQFRDKDGKLLTPEEAERERENRNPVTEHVVPRKDARDENLVVVGADRRGNPVTRAKSEGLGVENV